MVNWSEMQCLLRRPIAFNPIFVDVAGSPTAGILLSQLFYWTPRATVEGAWIRKTMQEWRDETHLTIKEIQCARRFLREAGVLEERRVGNPCKTQFRLVQDRLQDLLQKAVERWDENGAEILPEVKTKISPEVISKISLEVKTKTSPEVKTLHTEITTETTAETTPREVPSPRGGSSTNDQSFDAFWAEYPRKLDRKGCQAKWKRLAPTSEQAVAIMDGLSAWKSSRDWTKDNGQYIPHPMTWLNQERWLTPPATLGQTRGSLLHTIMAARGQEDCLNG